MIDVTHALIHHQVAASIYGKFGDYHNARRLAKGDDCDDDFLVQILRQTSIAAEKAVLDRLDTMPMNPVIDMAFDKWRVLLTGDMVRGIVRAALDAKP